MALRVLGGGERGVGGSLAVVTPVASLGRSGLSDFVVQRVSAVVLLAYSCCVLGFFVAAPPSHERLVAFFGNLPMSAFTTLAVLSLAAHAWIGMWTVGTDYIREHYFGRGHAVWLGCYQIVCLAVVFVLVVWPLSVVWGLRL